MAAKPIKIYADTAKGCMFFEGSQVEPKFLGIVQASVVETDRLLIIRADKTDVNGNPRRIFRRLKASRVQNEAGQYLIDDLFYSVAQVAAYINTESAKSPTDEIETSSFIEYDHFVSESYTGVTETGGAVTPWKTIAAAVAAANDGDRIFLKGDFQLTSEILLPADKSLHFYGTETTQVCYATYDAANGKLMNQSSSSCDKEYSFHNLKFINAGEYAIYIRSASKVVIKDCDFYRNGWSANGLSTTAAESSGTLGYDSSSADLQAFYAGSEASNGGAMRIRSTPVCEITDNRVYNNLRGLRIQDCGVGGSGIIARNQCFNNIESGIYLAAGSYTATDGCENFSVYNNFVANNANNGILVIGGSNNVVALNRVEGNWNAGVMLWHVSDTRARDMDLDNNNRSEFNGIGNTGDAQASIQLAGNTGRDTRTYMAEVLDTTVHNTGMGSASAKIGLYISDDIYTTDNPLVNIDDVAFVAQDYAILCDTSADDFRLTVSDCRFTDTTTSNIELVGGDYHELPYSNLHTTATDLDFSVDPTGATILVKENSNVIQTYKINELVAEAKGSKIRIKVKDSNRIQFDDLEVSKASIDNTLVNSVLADAIAQLNGIFSNTSGFATGGNPVASMVLSGDDLVLTLTDGTSFTVDVTTLGVDENKFVSSGAVSGTNLELTMSDGSTITINAANMVNQSQLPTFDAGWYFAFGSNSGNPVNQPTITTGNRDSFPAYHGSTIAAGEELAWTFVGNGSHHIGIWSGASEAEGADSGKDVHWAVKWRIANDGSGQWKVSPASGNGDYNSVGTDIASRYATGYDITPSSTLLAIRHAPDGYLELWDYTDVPTLISRSLTALGLTDIQIYWGGQHNTNQNIAATLPVMVKRADPWTIVHDFDDSEGGDWLNGIEDNTVLEHARQISVGQKFVLPMPAYGRGHSFGFGYSAGATGVSNAEDQIDNRFFYDTSERIRLGSASDWTFNTSASGYTVAPDNYWARPGASDAGILSIRYYGSNNVELWSESVGEKIATLNDTTTGDISLFFGAEENVAGVTFSQLPQVSIQPITGSSTPITNFAPDVSNQSFSLTEGAAFSIQLAKDAGSDIVSIWGATNLPSWAVLDQATGAITGTAPAWTDSAADVIAVDTKAANALGGITSFTTTLTVEELVYTNTKSLKFADSVSSYLGGNASLVTSLERSGNGSGSSEAWTVAFWYKGSTNNQGQTLFYFGNNDIVNNGHIEIKQTNHNGAKRLRFRYGTTGNYIQLTTPSGSITPSDWQHVMVTYDGGTTGVASGSVSDYYSRFKIFIDGVEQTTSNTHSNYGYGNSIVGQNFRFGKLVSGNYPRDAYLNQLAIWNSDRSGDIATLYNSGDTQDLSLLTGLLEPQHYYEITDSVTTIPDLIGTAHLVGYNFSATDLVTDAP